MRNFWHRLSITLYSLICLLTFSSFYVQPKIVEKIVEIEKIVYIDKTEYINVNVFLTGMNINTIIKFYKDNSLKDYEKILTFYDEYTKSRFITTTIIDYSLEYGNPINLMFSLARRESRFNPKLESKNPDKTWDRGLFQLNSGSRKTWKREDFFDIAKNTKEASGQMQWLLSVYDRDELAVAAYNAGYYGINKKILPYTTAIHVFEIKEFELEFDIGFNVRILPKLSNITFNEGKIELKI